MVTPPAVKKKVPKKVVPPKRVLPKKVVPKKEVRASRPIPVPKKQVVPKPPKKVVPKKKVPKKVIVKEPKKVVPKPPKSAKDLFSSVKTTTPKKVPVKKTPKRPVKEVVREQSSIKHNSSVTDRIKATHQSGQVSNANRDKGVVNAYIAKVKQRMNNWDAVGAKGQWVTINLTIFQSGKFRYTASGVNGAMRDSLTRYMQRLNRMGGLGRHTKSTPYLIEVRFRVN